MRIEYAIPAKFAEVNDGLATLVGAGIDTFASDSFPLAVSLMLGVRVIGTVDEFPGEHRIRCHVRASDDTIVGDPLDVPLELHQQAPRPDRPGPEGEWLTNLMLAVGVQFEAPQPGSYTIHMMFDDAEYPVAVHAVQLPAPS